jgi:hypothetical protein
MPYGSLQINKGIAYQEQVSIANGSTYDFTCPISDGVWAITIISAGQVTALFTAKLSGGSLGTYQLVQANGGTYFSFGTTSEPSGGSYGRLWYPTIANTIRLKNVGGGTFTFAISLIVYGGN